MKRTPMPARTTPLARSRTPMKAVNQTATKKRTARRRKEMKGPEHEAARQLAWERARGICECGCGVAFDLDAMATEPGYPEFHHENYKPGRVHGTYLRRACHHRIEMIHFGHRAARRKAVA